MSYISEAHARLVARISAEVPVNIPINPDAADFEQQRSHMERIAGFVDDYLHSLAMDARENSAMIMPQDFVGVVLNAIHDASLGAQFSEAAAECDEYDAEADEADHYVHLMRESA